MAEIVVTTSVRVTGECLARAREAGEFLGARVVARDRRGLAKLCEQERAEGVLVIGSTDVYHEPANGLEFFFHPNLAKMRIGNMKGGKPDHLVSAMGLREGDHVLDCTLGFAAEAIVCAWVVGESGRVVGLEKSPIIAFLAIQGLRRMETVSKAFTALMRRIEAIHADHMEYLLQCADKSFDLVYFDPIFDEPLRKSQSMAPLRAVAEREPLSEDAVREAVRVAKRRVVIKQRRNTELWTRIPVTRIAAGPGSRVEYGVIEAG